MIYLDNAATTYPKPEAVYRAIDDGMRNCSFNAGRGTYQASRKASDVIDQTRAEIGSLAGVNGSRVVFSSSATESLNQIILGLGLERGDVVFISPFEHNAIARPLHRLESTAGIVIKTIPFDSATWALRIDEFVSMLSVSRVKAVFASQVSNVTGYMLPYEEIFAAAKEYGATTILDSSQSFGILPVATDSVDIIVFAGHKALYGPFGIAGMIFTGKVLLEKVKAGGTGSDSLNLEMPDTLPGMYEAGSPNVVAINGLKAALDWRKTVDVKSHDAELTSYLIEGLKMIDGVKLFMPDNCESPIFSVVSFAYGDYESSQIGEILDADFGIAVRCGYHCAPFVHDFIYSRPYRGTIRASVGYFNQLDDIDKLLDAMRQF